MNSMNLTLGPIPFHWSEEEKLVFYGRIADEAPIDTVYLGEVICSKRAPFFDHRLGDVAERLEAAGKTVVFAGLAEVMLKRERNAAEGLAGMEDREIEINNASGLYHRAGRPHRVGPFLNVYNEATLRFMAGQGMTHVTVPPEMPGEAIAVLAAAAQELGVGVEVQAFGRASLAVSARCYHARAHGRTKDNCLFVCEDDPDGMPLDTRDGQSFLRINGIQTLSESYVCLADEVPQLATMGVTDLRLMPQRCDMVAVARAFRALLDGEVDRPSATAKIEEATEAGLSNGFFHGQAGYRRIEAAGRSAA